jgi:hypothetical protein
MNPTRARRREHGFGRSKLTRVARKRWWAAKAEREGLTAPSALPHCVRAVALAEKLHCVDLFTSGRTSVPSGSNGRFALRRGIAVLSV